MTPTVRDVLLHLLFGLALLVVLAAGPWAALDLPVRFPAAALAVYAAAVPLILSTLPERLPGDRFGPANDVTLVRLAATAVLTAALALPAGNLDDARLGWLLCVLAVAAFALDGVDGWLARRRRVATRFGARFDMELDAFVTLVLAALVWRLDQAGAWVMIGGLLRYAFVAAGWLWPPLRRDLPPSRLRRFVCAVHVGTLSAVLAPVIPAGLATTAVAAALSLLCLSFARDVLWLVRRR